MENVPGHYGASFRARIVLPSALAVALFVAATFLFIIPAFERNMLDRKRETIRELNNSVHSLLDDFHRQERLGRISGDEARRQAAEALRGLRYGPENKDYFWVTDLGPKMVMHPYRPDLEGSDLSDFRDSHGKRLFVESAEISRRSGAGYVDYMWQWKDDPKKIVPKLSHVRLFEPWGWVTGTGIYVEDVREEIDRLESSLITISLLIAAIIAIILLYVNHQSLRIERSRRLAERQRAESEEKYRKLVEASTEGIVMVLGGSLVYSNRTVQELLGREAEELEHLGLEGILHPSSSASADQMRELLVSGGAPPQVEATLTRADGEGFRALLAASKISFGGREGFILTVKDIDRHRKTEEELSESRERFRLLTDAIDLGVLRFDLAGRRVTEANPAAARILGYAGPGELCRAGAAALKPLEEAGMLQEAAAGRAVREAPLLTAPGGLSVLVSLMPLQNGEETPRLCDGLLEDVTARKRAEAEREKLLTDLQMSLGSLNQSVCGVSRKAVSCPASLPVSKAAELMTAAGSSCVYVESDGEYLGIVTDRDLRARVLAGSVSPADPVSRVMSAPLFSVPETALLFEAVLLMRQKDIRHLAVRDDSGKITGVLDEKELLALKWYTPAAVMEEIARASSPEETAALRARVPAMVKTLSDSGAGSPGMTRLISAASDAAAARFAMLAALELGKPPVPFAFLSLGSQARREQTLVSDQDNALVYADPPPGREGEAAEYFQALGTEVCAGLAAAGLPFCRGGAMANNPKWCRPLADWKSYFTGWAAASDAQGLLDVNVFFDFRLAAGDQGLEESLRAHVRSAVAGKKIFFLNLANNALLYKPPLGFRGGLALEDSGELRGTFDAKDLMRVFSDFARVYALRYDVPAVPTRERLSALVAANALDRAEEESFSRAFEFLMRLRLRRQAAQVAAGAAPDNRVKPAELSQADQQELAAAAAAATEVLNKVRNLVKFLIV